MECHMTMHTGNSSFICAGCGDKFFTAIGMRRHKCERSRKRPDTETRIYDKRHCRFCDHRFANFDENKAHICKYLNPDDSKMVTCRLCSKYITKHFFNRHIETHFSAEVCKVCGTTLISKRALKSKKISFCLSVKLKYFCFSVHMAIHPGNSSANIFRCKICFKDLSSTVNLRRHIQKVHQQIPKCELCKADFSSRDELKNHMDTTHETFACDICSKTFSLPRYLKMHQKLHYDDSNKVQCQFCQKSLIDKKILWHVSRTHPKEFPGWLQNNPMYK